MSEDYRHKEADCRHWAKATDDVVLKMNLLEWPTLGRTWPKVPRGSLRHLIRNFASLPDRTV
jgi:hypothetical protein